MPDAERPDTGSQTVPPAEEPAAEAPKRPGVIDALADFVQMFVDYVRQETGDLVHDKAVVPLQKAGQVVAFALAAAFVLSLGVGFLSVGALLVLAHWLGWPGALFLVGGVLVVLAAGFTYAKTKRKQ